MRLQLRREVSRRSNGDAFSKTEKYSKNLTNLAANGFANLGSNAITVDISRYLVSEWRVRVLAESRAYNPATGQCVGSPCEHYRQIVQSNVTEFGCAVKRCYLFSPGIMLATKRTHSVDNYKYNHHHNGTKSQHCHEDTNYKHNRHKETYHL
ncbi:hypothetical protein TcWFU_004097 [Taenia crassiceps]|uniref:SCP domain-containing protein n=1 Tax=Taenia crassiceps TaxID=6207 RepID=A0ABR4QBA9_9CEST